MLSSLELRVAFVKRIKTVHYRQVVVQQMTPQASGDVDLAVKVAEYLRRYCVTLDIYTPGNYMTR